MNRHPTSTAPTSRPPNAGRAFEPDSGSAGPESEHRPPTPAELHALNAALAQEFPVAIDATELVLMDVDPTRLHAFWSVMPADLEAVEPALQPVGTRPAMVLRLHDVTPARFGHADRARSVDIDVEGLQGNRYIDHLEPGKSYSAELGRVGRDGALAVIAESNTLLMPGVASPLPSSTPESVTEKGPEPPKSKPRDRRPVVRLPDLDPVFPNAGETEPWRSLSLLPTGSQSDAQMARQTAGLEATHPAAGGPTASLPAFDAQRADGSRDFTSQVSPPAWSGRVPGLSSWSSWSSFGGYSSSDLVRSETDLELTVELLVRGRTRPGGQLNLFGRPVALGPDGSFSLRQRLPDGVIPLALVFGQDPTANDGDR